jgi:UDP-N-acetylglucosamine--N-acetylmuramyl-(pentapeptide) pyrophosphoryl-undecaprenol N-acetylglucosamine transferase
VLARLADKVLVGFPDAFGPRVRAEWTGNPVRADIAALPAPGVRYAQRTGALRLLVLGGSLGAQALNESVPQALALMPHSARPRVTHQTGAAHVEDVRRRYEQAGLEAEVVPFIEDMARCYGETDLAICRAGASTIAELTAAGVAAVLVPFPHAVDDHQTRNARFLVERGAAVLVPQRELTPRTLATLIAGFARERLLAMASAARALAKPEATRVVAETCMRLAA